jgi:2-polyprenyl-3-methyl-5-hydroxy-6-metoxy-1,4-benzoquinol methylase
MVRLKCLVGEMRGSVGGMTAYTHGHHESVLRSHSWRTAENSAAYLLGQLSPGMSLLDVGCGPGTITADLAPAGE